MVPLYTALPRDVLLHLRHSTLINVCAAPCCPLSPQRVVLQRVTSASVRVGGQSIASIGRGVLVLVGIHRDDAAHDAAWMAGKLLSVRLWDVGDVPWKGSVASEGLDVLLVSQFTLHAELKGNKPDFHASMPPAAAKVRMATHPTARQCDDETALWR